MTTARWSLRLRLGALVSAGFAGLLLLGALALYLFLGEGFRTEFDRNLLQSARAAMALWELDRAEYPNPNAAIEHVVGELVFGDRVIAAFDSTGNRVAISRRYPGAPLLNDLRPTMPRGQPVTVQLRKGRARVIRVSLGEGLEVLVGLSMAELDERMGHLRLLLGVGLPVIILIGAGFGAWLAGPALHPIVVVARTADRIGQDVAGGALELPRLPPREARDEITTLTTAFNALLDRLSEALQREHTAADRQRAFLANAAHELRTPIAIVQSQAEAALGGPVDAAEYRRALERVAEETQGLGGLVGDLLLMARGESTGPVLARERVYLDDLANRAVGRVRSLPVARGRTIQYGEFEAAPAAADPPLIERAILILLHNALLHAAPSPVELGTGTSRTAEGGIRSWLRVRDWGPGIPPAEHARIFERFSRLNTAAPGTGLGLAIARWIVELHGGTLTLESAPGQGATFTLSLPGAI